MIREAVKPSAREQGIIRFYSSEQGRGFISARNREYQFRLIDVVGTLKPELGDRVEFSSQLVNERQLARQVVLARNPQFIDFHGPSSAPRRALDLNRPAPPPSRSPVSEAPKQPVACPSVYLRCQACHRLVKPKRVRSRFGLGSGRASQWISYCPLCKTRQIETGEQAPRPARRLLGLLLVGLLAGIGLGLL